MMTSNNQPPTILKPIPQRNFRVTPASSDSSAPSTPAEPNPLLLDAKLRNEASTPSRTRSILNLTSSTLFGIYLPTGDNEREDSGSTWGTGLQTPSRQSSSAGDARSLSSRPEPQHIQRRPTPQPHQPHPLGFSNFIFPLAVRTLLLFIFGIAYGVIITHLHDNRHLAPVQVEGFDRHDWRYLFFWGAAGVGLGSLLPWVDLLWDEKVNSDEIQGGTASSATSSLPKIERDRPSSINRRALSGAKLGADWNPVVRSIGAFVGIAFAIRKLPWQSTLQVSLTLALVNPVLWYLIDRSKPGFLLSAAVGLTGTALLLGINPDIVPAPTTPHHHPAHAYPSSSSSSPPLDFLGSSWRNATTGMVSTESIGVGTWIASVLFCSCVCFGNIGRRLALR